MNSLFFKITLLFYLGGTLLFLSFLAGRSEKLSRSSLWVTGIGFIFHSTALILRWTEAGYIPLTNMHEATSFFSWALILLFLIIEYKYRIFILGSFILPLAFIFLISSAMLPNNIKSLDPILRSKWLYIHTILSLLGIVAFAMAFVTGFLYLMQERILKSKKFNTLYFRLPSLDLLDDLNQKSISIGFPLLTLGIITGAFWAEYAWGSYWSWDPKQVFSFITWLFYLTVLHGRLTVGWRAKRAAYLAIIGFMGVIFTFVVISFFIKGLHTFV